MQRINWTPLIFLFFICFIHQISYGTNIRHVADSLFHQAKKEAFNNPELGISLLHQVLSMIEKSDDMEAYWYFLRNNNCVYCIAWIFIQLDFINQTLKK